MKIRTSFLILNTNKPVKEDASKFRGYIANKFPEYPILHHHVGVGLLYTYPRVQYRVISGTPSILGIEDGAKILKKISDNLNELTLGNTTYKVKQKTFHEQEVEVKPSRKNQHYRFITHWLALNPENYRKYKELRDWKEKKEFLNSILVGNILSMCKALGIVVRKKLHVHSHLDREGVST